MNKGSIHRRKHETIPKSLGIETLFILSAILGLCNSAYAATIKVKKQPE